MKLKNLENQYILPPDLEHHAAFYYCVIVHVASKCLDPVPRMIV